MRSLGGLGVLLLLVAMCDTTIIRRNKRQLVPLAASCDMYTTCAPPAVCMSGHCQCAQPYLTLASSCVAAYPRLMSPVLTSGTALHYLQPQQAPVAHSAAYLQAAPMQYPAQMYHPSQPGYPVAQSAMPHPPPQQIPGYYPPHPQQGLPPTQPQQPPVTNQITDSYVTATEHTTTTTQQRLYDQQPYIAYPGGFCRIPEIVCVGGSSCENNVCVCRRGEEVVNGQCQRIEVPLVTEGSTTLTSSSTSTTVGSTSSTNSGSTTTTTRPTTTAQPTTTTTTTTEPTTTTMATTTTTAVPTTSTTAMPTTTTTATETTTTMRPISTSQYIGRDEQPQMAPSRCVNCCPPGAQNCPPQVIRINLSYAAPPGSTKCQNSVDCRRGSFCRQGICR